MTAEQVGAAGFIAWLLVTPVLARFAWRSYRTASQYLRSVDAVVGPEQARQLRRGTAPTYLVIQAMEEDPVREDAYTWRLRRFPSHREIGATKKLSVLRLYEQELRLQAMVASVVPVVGLSVYGIALSFLVDPWLRATRYLWQVDTSNEWGTMLVHTAASLVGVGVPLLAVAIPLLASVSVWRRRRRIDKLSARVKETILVRLEEQRFHE